MDAMLKLVITAVCVVLCLGQTPDPCVPSACLLPNCRCFSDPNIPGDLTPQETPQMVVLTMDYTLNSEYQPLYDQIFVVNNPNGCPTTGSFYLQDFGTNYALAKDYYDKNFEIGISSLDGTVPQDATGWINMIKSVKDKIVPNGIDDKDILGYRAPQLAHGGNDMMIGLSSHNLMYDSSCSTSEYASQTTLKWPFTYDYDYGSFTCNGGRSVTLKFPGMWQIMIPQMEFNGQVCGTPQGCSNVLVKKDAFDLLYNNFVEHYDGKRSPYVVVIDPAWMKTDFKLEGLIQFVEYVRAAFDDVWIVNQMQAFRWIQDPTPIANLTDFAPWSCT